MIGNSISRHKRPVFSTKYQDVGATWGNIVGTLSNQTDLASELAAKAPLANPTFTGQVRAPELLISGETASRLAIIDASQIVRSANTATYPSLTELAFVKGLSSAVQTQLDTKAPLASPTFTGTPAAPTAGPGTNTTQVATTAFVQAAGVVGTYATTTFTPTVTLVGGAGNTVPQYSVNAGEYTRTGNRVFFDINLSGDGGNEGAGTGQLTIALPIAISASMPAGFVTIGWMLNNTTYTTLTGIYVAGATTIALFQFGPMTALTGAAQNNATRSIRIQGNYMV